MQVITEEQSAMLITHEMALEGVRQALIAAVDGAATFDAVLGHGSDPSNRFSVKSAATGDFAGLKVGSYWPRNFDKGLPRHSSTTLLFDEETGRIAWVVEGSLVNAYRTAAADAIAAAALSREDASTLAVFGTGRQARFECLALARVRPVKRVLVVGRDRCSAAEFAISLEAIELSTEIVSAETACARADIIVTATPARAPLFAPEWVRSGTHVASMGSDAVGKQELPPALFPQSRLFCDLPDQSRRIGEFQHAGPDQLITPIGEVLTERAAGRFSADEITIFDSSGISLQDLYVAQRIVAAFQSRSERPVNS